MRFESRTAKAAENAKEIDQPGGPKGRSSVLPRPLLGLNCSASSLLGFLRVLRALRGEESGLAAKSRIAKSHRILIEPIAFWATR
jgi:hypothetical protein